MSNDIPDVPVEPMRRSLWERFSIVWLVPFGALLIALGVAWNAWVEQGPLVEITFEDAAGIAPDETELRYRNVTVGIVEELRFSANLDEVIVAVRLDKSVAPFVDADATFWIVKPEVTTTGVSGLDTVLSGVYIEGYWDTQAGGLAESFDGMERPPLVGAGREGLRIELRTSRDGGLTETSPLLFKGIEVGRVGEARISQDGRWVFADAIIYEPHDRLVTTATRFWDTSGFSFSLGPSGAAVDFSTIASLLAGGITFETIVSGGRVPQEGTVFEVFPDEAAARSSIFESFDGTTVTLSVIFEENISGLAAEAPVEWRGVSIGEVANVTGIVDLDRFGDERVRLLATLEIRPSRFGLTGDLSEADALQFLADRVAEGLRARLVSASILTGGLKVEFLTIEDAPSAILDLDNDPFPAMPVTDSEVADVSATAEGVFQRINALPIEDLLSSAIGFLDNATAFVTSEDIRETPGELRGLLSDARGVLGSEEIQALPGEVGVVMTDLQGAVGDLRGILAEFSEADAMNRLLAAVDRAGAAAEAAEATINEIPALIDRVNTLVDTANGLPLDSLLAEATGLAEDARGVIGSDAAQSLPGQLVSAVGDLEAILAGLTDAGAAAQLSEALAAAQSAANAVETAVAGVPEIVESAEIAITGIPALIERVNTFVDTANALPLDRLLAQATGLAEDARTVIGSTEAQSLPGQLVSAVGELEAVLASLTEAGTAAQLSQALTAAETAATAVETAVAGVPQVVERIDAIAANVEQVPLDRLADELAGVLDTADTLFGDAAEARLPESLSGALDEARLALAELREGGLIENANETLAATERAAAAVAEAAEDLPAVVARVDAALAQARTTLANFDDSSTFTREAQQALRDVQKAADAVESLARALERRPNSILIGR